MADDTSGLLSERLHQLSEDLRAAEIGLKSGIVPEALLLQEFRQVLDNARMTAWTVSELQNARKRQQDPAQVISFVVAERLRRANQMLKDLSADIEQEGITWQTQGVQNLFDTVKLLQVQLLTLVDENKTRFEKMSEVGK